MSNFYKFEKIIFKIKKFFVCKKKNMESNNKKQKFETIEKDDLKIQCQLEFNKNEGVLMIPLWCLIKIKKLKNCIIDIFSIEDISDDFTFFNKIKTNNEILNFKFSLISESKFVDYLPDVKAIYIEYLIQYYINFLNEPRPFISGNEKYRTDDMSTFSIEFFDKFVGNLLNKEFDEKICGSEEQYQLLLELQNLINFYNSIEAIDILNDACKTLAKVLKHLTPEQIKIVFRVEVDMDPSEELKIRKEREEYYKKLEDDELDQIENEFKETYKKELEKENPNQETKIDPELSSDSEDDNDRRPSIEKDNDGKMEVDN